MFKSLINLPLLVITCLTLQIHQVNAQSIEVEWQQAATNKDRHLAQFDQYALRGDFQALLLGLERRKYNPPGAAAQSLSSLDHMTIGVQYYSQLTEDYALWPRLQIHAGYNDHISSDALTYNPQFVVIRQFADHISVVGGVGVLVHTAQNQYYPVFGLVWESSEHSRWSGNLTVPEGDIAYRLNEQWFAEAGLKWQTQYYKTDQSFSDTAFMRTQDVLISFGVRAEVNSSLRVSGRTTYALQRDVRLYSDDTNSQISESPASGVGFRVVIGYDF